MGTVGRAVVDFDANTVKLEKKIGRVNKRLDRFGRRGERLGRTFSNVFAGIAAAASGFLARSIVDAGNKMEGFERTLAVAAGSAAGAAREMKFLKDLTEELGVNFEASASSFGKFAAAAKGSPLAGEPVRKIFTSISKAARVLNLNTADTTGVFRALEQMMSKGKVQAEELRGQLGERLPGAFNLAAKAMGVTTKELDKMLKLGKITTEDLLPKLARELENLFGSQVAAASASAAANIERFNNALFMSKVAAAEGLLPAVSLITAKLADSMPVVVDFTKAIGEIFAGGRGFGAFADALDKQIDPLLLRRNQLLKEIEAAQKPGARADGLLGDLVRQAKGIGTVEEQVAKYRAELEKVNSELETLKRRQLEAFDTGPTGSTEEISEIFVTAKKKVDNYGNSLKLVQKRFATAEEKAAKLRSTLNLFRKDLSAGQIQGIESEIEKTLFGGINEIELGPIRRMKRVTKKAVTEMSQFTKQAARNMQSAFADFLFDPFDKGLKGMLKGFVNILRRLAAEKASAAILNSFEGGFFSGISKLFGGGKAHGGQVSAGTSYLVGERGPELFEAPTSGRIIPNSKLGSGAVVNQVFNFEAGADIATIRQEIIPLLAQTKAVTIIEIKKMREEGRF